MNSLIRALALALVVVGATLAHADTADLKTGTLSAATSTAVVPFNKDREELFICNAGATNPMTCTTLGTATADNGFVLPVNCANPINWIRGALAQKAVYCFSASGTKYVWTEVVRDRSLLSAPTPTPVP